MAGPKWVILNVQYNARIWHLQFNKCSRPQACLSWLLGQVVWWGSRLLSSPSRAACLLLCRCQAAPPVGLGASQATVRNTTTCLFFFQELKHMA